jgi:hypothetical protein
VKRFVRKLQEAALPEAVGIIQTAAGEEAQVDYGSGPMVRDPQSGKYRRTRLFVMTLPTVANPYICCYSVRVPGCGPNCMRKLFVAWVGVRGS